MRLTVVLTVEAQKCATETVALPLSVSLLILWLMATLDTVGKPSCFQALSGMERAGGKPFFQFAGIEGLNFLSGESL